MALDGARVGAAARLHVVRLGPYVVSLLFWACWREFFKIVILFVKGQIKSRPEGQKNRRRLQARAKRVTVSGGVSDPMFET